MSVLRILDKLDDFLANIAIAAIMIITVIAVFMRYIANDPLQWIEEVLIALFIWAIMLGAASAMKNRQHVSIDAFTVLMPAKVQYAIRIINHLIMISVLSVFGVLGMQLAIEAQDKITPILSIKYMYIDIAVPIGAFWMVLHVMRHLYKDIKTGNKEQ